MGPAPVPTARRASWRRSRELRLDAALALFAFAIPLLSYPGRTDGDADAADLDAAAVLLIAAASLPLVAWRRSPLAAFAVMAAASSVLSAQGFPPGPPIGATIALFFLARDPERVRTPRWSIAATVVSLFLLHVAAAGIGADELPTVPLLFGMVVWGGAWIAGDRVRLRRLRIAELEERARRNEREAERERRLAVAEERTRIARDLHDSAGHAINVILVQAGAARLLAESDPARSQAAIRTIEEVARETIGEIDTFVRSLRDHDARVRDAKLDPPPGIDALPTLLERHRTAGQTVTVRTHGGGHALPQAVDHAAFRILQEALTNAARHGNGTAGVEIAYRDDALEITVTNPQAGPAASAGPGHGIIGMRERAALLGGTFEAAAADGQFRIHARLPYESERT